VRVAGLRLDAWPRCNALLSAAPLRHHVSTSWLRAYGLHQQPPRTDSLRQTARVLGGRSLTAPPAGLSPSPAQRCRFSCAPSLCLRACLHPVLTTPANPYGVGTLCASAPGSCRTAALIALAFPGRSGAAISQATELRKRRWQQCQTGPCDKPGERMNTARESKKSGSTWSKPWKKTL
jgi:hypothetical protein